MRGGDRFDEGLATKRQILNPPTKVVCALVDVLRPWLLKLHCLHSCFIQTIDHPSSHEYRLRTVSRA